MSETDRVINAMIFTDLLKKEVFGTETKSPRLANAKIVERRVLPQPTYQPASILKTTEAIAIIHNNEK